MYTAGEIERRSNQEEFAVPSRRQRMVVGGEVATTLARQRLAVSDSSAHAARQALQESMDLREQGHFDD